MKKLIFNSDGFSAIEGLLVIVTLAIIGLAGYFVAKHIDQKTTTTTATATTRVATNKPVNPTTTTTPTASPTASNSLFKIPELGIEFNIPQSLNDLTYSAKTTPQSNNSGGTEISATMSSKSLANIDPKCAATSSYGGFEAIVVGTENWPYGDHNLEDGVFIKQFSTKYVFVSWNQMYCTSDNGGINIYQKDKVALEQALQSVKLIQ